MATQVEVLKDVERIGFYAANLYKFKSGGICVRGIRDVSPAEKLVAKGKLVLKHKSTESIQGVEITRFTWVKAPKLKPLTNQLQTEKD